MHQTKPRPFALSNGYGREQIEWDANADAEDWCARHPEITRPHHVSVERVWLNASQAFDSRCIHTAPGHPRPYYANRREARLYFIGTYIDTVIRTMNRRNS